MQSLQFLLVVLWVAVCSGAEGGALEDYVKHAEAHFAWQKVEEANTNGFRITHLALTSQQWREYVWTHNLRVVRPENVRNADIAFLFITGDGAGTRTLGLLQTQPFPLSLQAQCSRGQLHWPFVNLDAKIPPDVNVLIFS